MKIFFLGLPGSGKTTLARAVAKSLDISFIDLDWEIEQAAGISIQAIFKKNGEEMFRKMEAAQLKRWCASPIDFVMATGGGTPCFSDNLELLNKSGTTFFMDVPSQVIAKRLLKGNPQTRPLFAGTHPEELKDKIEFMRSQRIAFYRQAHHTIGEETQIDDLLVKIRKEYPQ